MVQCVLLAFFIFRIRCRYVFLWLWSPAICSTSSALLIQSWKGYLNRFSRGVFLYCWPILMPKSQSLSLCVLELEKRIVVSLLALLGCVVPRNYLRKDQSHSDAHSPILSWYSTALRVRLNRLLFVFAYQSRIHPQLAPQLTSQIELPSRISVCQYAIWYFLYRRVISGYLWYDTFTLSIFFKEFVIRYFLH